MGLVTSCGGNTTETNPVPTGPSIWDELPTIDYVKVFSHKNNGYTHVYAWIGSNTELLGKWPGTAMTEYSEDTNYLTYDFHDHVAFNIIFNNASNSQTPDLSIPKAGYYWCIDNKISAVPPSSGSQGGVTPYEPPTDIPQGNYTKVDRAKDYTELPAVKNFTGTIVNKYSGTRNDFRDESIYFIITTRFYDGDSGNNTKCWDGKNNAASDPAWRGDFKGLIEKMDYIKALGFTSIWITPIVKNASGYDYHGYHAINFKDVDPRYESEDVSFQEVINEAHKRDMKIILDVVFNHTGNFGEENMFPMFYYDSEHNTTIKGIIRNKESGLLPDSYDSLPGGQQYSMRIDAMKDTSSTSNRGKDDYHIYHHEKNMSYEQYIEQTGQMAGDCVDLNTENPTVANYLIEAYSTFIKMGVDAFRIDTMKHISRLTFNKYLWPGLYEVAKKCGNTNFFMFGEVCTRVREVWNHGQASDSAPFYTWKENKNYNWGTRATNEASTLENWNDNANTNQRTTSNAYLSNMSLLFTFRGVPCIFYGSEIEFQKGKTIDKGTDIALADSGRAYYGDNIEGNVTANGFGSFTASGKVNETLNKPLAKHLQQLNKIRLQVPALRRGQYKSFGDLSFVRRYTSGNVDSIACVSISHGCTFTGLPSGLYKDMISGNQQTVSNGTLSVSVSGQGNLAIYVRQ